MKNTGVAYGLVIKGNYKVQNAIQSLSKFGQITFSREQEFKSSKYAIHFFKPTEELRGLYNLGNEVLILSCSDGMTEFRSRTKDYIDYLLTTREEFKNRLDKITCFIVDKNPDIVSIVENDRKQNPDSRLIIPFCLNELQKGITTEAFNNRLREFLYVRDLFGIASPLNNEAMFFGKDRTDLITDLYGKYKQGEPGGLFGLRRIGKTSVLLLLKNRIIKDGGAAVYFDCSRYHHSRWNSFLMQIIDRVSNEYNFNNEGNYSKLLPEDFSLDLKPERYSEENAINSFESDIRDIYEALGRVRIHLIFDEIESIGFTTSASDHWRNGNDAVFFWEALRSISQMNNEFFSYLIAGVNPKCIELPTINGNANPIFGSFSPIYMKLFDDEDVNYMISSIGGHLGLKFENSVCAKLVEDYGGHPFLTRQVCSRINRNLLDNKVPRPAKVTKYDYELHADEFRLDMTNVIEQILGVLESFYPNEFELLKKLALDGRGSLKKENMEGDKSVQHLLGYCLIKKYQGEYFIQIRSIQEHLQNKFLYDKSLNTQADKRARINMRRDNIEVSLRKLVWNNNKIKYGKKAYEKIVEFAIKDTADNGQASKLKAKKGQDVMDELYLSQIGHIIEKQWKDYQNTFIDKNKYMAFFDILNDSRKVGAHSKQVDEDEEVMYSRAFKYFEECLEDW